MKNIIHYTDYRTYLRDMAIEKKEIGYFSNRWFADKVGINSSSWFTSIVQGKKGLSRESAAKISLALKHKKKEAEYFELLVMFNQAETPKERAAFYAELQKIRKYTTADQVNPTQYEYYTTWYHSVIRSLIGMFKFTDNDCGKIARLVFPTITTIQAKNSLELLEKLEMIKKEPEGHYILRQSSITTGEHEKALAIINYQSETMRLAWESLDRVKKQERDISTLTLGISDNGAAKIQEALKEFRDKVSQIAIQDEPSDRVYQLNMQLFPLSIAPEKNGPTS